MYRLFKKISGFSALFLTILISLSTSVAFTSAIAQQEKTPISQVLRPIIDEEGIEAAIAQFYELRKNEPTKYDYSYRTLARFGFNLIREERYEDAVGICRLNVELYPDNYNVYVYLGYAYIHVTFSEEGDGDPSLALENLEKARNMNPDSPFIRYCFDLIEVITNYTRESHNIPMRDGKTLFTHVYSPNDQSQKYPILINRRPYGISDYKDTKLDYVSLPGPSDLFMKEKYIFVVQDVRGRFLSEGEFMHMRPHKDVKTSPTDIDESSDTYDTIDWLVKNIPNNNGKVALWGTSYMGFYSVMSLLDSHPALAAAAPAASPADWFMGDDPRRNSALYYLHAVNFFNTEGLVRGEPTDKRPVGLMQEHPDDFYTFLLELGPVSNVDAKYFKGGNYFWNQIMEHNTYDDFWKERTTLPHLKNIKGPVMNIGGWFDAEDLYGTFKTYQAIEKQNPGIVNTLVIGPWYHGGWGGGYGDYLGDVKLNSESAAKYFQEKVEFPFFQYHLKGKGQLNLPEVLVFETGSNQWREYTAWPPEESVSKELYLASDGELSFAYPTTSDDKSYDEFASDPAHPVPFLGYPVDNWTYEWTHADQRFAAERSDVLVYTTDVLEEDVTIVGPMMAELFVSTTGTDADWIVKLIDVYPDDAPDDSPNKEVKMGGYQMLVRGDILRGKFRNSFEKPEPFTPGEITKVSYEMMDTNHTFQKGHRIMVQVQSTWFPLYDRNPQKFTNIYTAKPEDFQRATHRLYRSEEFSSRIKVKVMPK